MALVRGVARRGGVIRDRHSWRAHVRRARTACRSCRHDRARQEPEVTARTTWCARGCVAPAPLHRVPQSRRAGRCVLPECSRRILHTGVEPVAIPLSGCGARRGQRGPGPATEESHEYRLTAGQTCRSGRPVASRAMDHGCCEACGFDGAGYDDVSLLDALRVLGPRWRRLLGESGADLRVRPEPDVWSAIEYAAHSRDIT